MKEKQSKCSIEYISYYDPPLVGLHISDLSSLLYIGSKIYIEKIFSNKYPNNIFDWLQGENRNLHKISWEKKSNLVDGKYREASGEHYGTVQNSGNLKCRPQMLSGWTL